jgi:predicted ester cyclase
MSTEQNKQLVLRWKEQFWNGKGDLNLVDEFFAPDIVCHMIGVPVPVRGREAFKQLLATLVAAFDNIHETPEFIIAEGDMVVIRETARAKHGKGAFQGIPPTGKEVRITNNEINRIVEGKIVEQWVGFDMLRIMQQLGGIPTPGHAGQ